ncbi:MAG: ABC transporter substrate-binding protein [Alphaproteobacteria bacterium]|nr:ABC transporter substrate-binding protein [Alphaproteobacteria bacterium]
MIALPRPRRWLGRAAAALLAATAVAPSALAQEKVLRAVMHADVRTLDPFWTTQTIAGIHGMLVYDTLFGLDDDMVPRPQMVSEYQISGDRKTYTMTLRGGLKFHDGTPVTTKDVVATLKRWGARDPAGQRLLSFTESFEIVNDKTFKLILKEPYGQVLHTLGKTGTNVPVIMREKEAMVDPNTQIQEAIGSGPYKFAREQWVPGSKTVYVKNADYVPRAEPPSTFAGGKIPGVDRIELLWIPDAQTAMQALINGEIDYYEVPPIDFLPILEKARGVKLLKPGKFDNNFGLIRLNHLHPPFNNVRARQAMYRLINQEDYLRTFVGNADYYRVCHAMLVCGSAFANDAGSAMLKEYNPKKALAELKEAGYKGEPITVLLATDHVIINASTQVLIQSMRDAGITLDVQSMDWGSVVQRRAKKEPPAQGGWNIFVTTSGTISGSNPVLHTWIGAACDRGLFGWPCDSEIEKLRSAFGFAQSDEERMKVSRDLQARAIHQVVYLPFGQWTQPIAYRADRISGVLGVPGLAVLWNIKKN